MAIFQTRAARGHVRPSLLILLGAGVAAGLACIALPWVRWQQPMPLSGEIDAGSSAYAELVAIATAADRACAAGDLVALTRHLTPDYIERIDDAMRDLGKKLTPDALRQRGFLVGPLAPSSFVRGEAAGNDAVLVFARTRPAVAGAATTTQSVLALHYHWDGYGFRLHQVRNRPVAPAERVHDTARVWTAELLGLGRRQ